MSGDSPHRPGPRPRRDPNWPSSPIVRILIVCDDEFSYATDERFGLTELIGALEAPSLFVSFALTKAHRETSPYSEQADVQSFRFDNAEHFNASGFVTLTKRYPSLATRSCGSFQNSWIVVAAYSRREITKT